MAILLVMGRLSWASLTHSARASAQLSIMIFMIVIAVQLFTRFLVLTDVPGYLITLIGDAGLNRYVVLLIIVLMYLVLGMMLDSLGMMLLTLPFVFPIILHLGFDAVWFGVILTLMVEIGLLTPPVEVQLLHPQQGVAGDLARHHLQGRAAVRRAHAGDGGRVRRLPRAGAWLPHKMFSGAGFRYLPGAPLQIEHLPLR